MVRGLLPVAASTLRITGGSANYPPTAHVDVNKGSLVPDPRVVGGNLWSDLHVLSWDVGPVVLYRHADNTATPVDLRDRSLGQPAPFTLDLTSPIIAVPGEPIRWFTADSPPRASWKVNDANTTTAPASTVFPGLLLTDAIVDTTILYGQCRSVFADATATLDDGDIRAIAATADRIGVNQAELMAVLYLLSSLHTTAYHPHGNYGLAQMNADQLRAGGWAQPPDTILEASGAQQMTVLAAYLATLPAHPDSVWSLAVMLTGTPVPDTADATVVARAPFSARLAGYATVSATGVVADTVTIADLRRAVTGVLTGPAQRELRNRVAETCLA